MLGRKRDRDLLLASLHEDLSSEDQARLDKALENSAELRKEHDDLRLLVAAIPRDESDLNIDLLPLVRKRLEGPAAQHERTPAFGWRMASFAAASLAVVFVFAMTLQGTAPPSEESTSLASVTQSPLQLALENADRLLEEGNFTGAHEVLTASLSANKPDQFAPQVQLKLADVCYDDLRWYGQAEAAYKAYRDTYRTEYTMNDERREAIDFRLLALDEAAPEEYAPLLAVEAASGSEDRIIASLEQTIVEHPAGYVAALAVQKMAHAVAASADLSGRGYVQAMETARLQCTQPVAVDQINVEIALYYHDKLSDKGMAIRHLEQAAQSGNTRVATAAQSYLARFAGR